VCRAICVAAGGSILAFCSGRVEGPSHNRLMSEAEFTFSLLVRLPTEVIYQWRAE
jgi:hypothetical protein